MSLNCLTCRCSHVLERSDSYNELFTRKVDRSLFKCETTLKGGALSKIKAEHRRVQSAGDVPSSPGSEPRLVRSSGVRRDWNLENLVVDN
ncbi:hypothetical protein S83_014344 [Arachis hypogaea]|uniref:Uncharacterized protein n=1 Tax=Arachis hypogaea TaxID=3818 RepID=A0A444WVU8_ARAHY|nr:hypothetical protein Ahy_Scaffold1g107440 [Arachis hypogaea]